MTDTRPAGESDVRFSARLREAWHKTVGTYATDERGTASLLDRLVGFGHLSAEEAKRVLAEARTRIEENKRELDARVDESVKKVTDRLTGPFADPNVTLLEDRIAFLEKRIHELEAVPSPPSPSTPPTPST